MSHRTLSVSIPLIIAALAAGCAEPTVPVAVTESLVAINAGPAATATTLTPVSLGWQERARAMAASANMSPLAATRMYAAVSVAQYRAVLAIPDHDRTDVTLEQGIGAGGRNAVELCRGAVAGASARVLGYFFSAAAASLDARALAEGEVGAGNLHPQFAEGLAIGHGVGDAMVARLMTDGFTTPWTGTVPTGPGMWIAAGTPAGATFSGVKPYALDASQQFRPGPPPAFGSAAFETDLTEVVTLSTGRTPAQLALANQWNYPGGTFTPPGYWNQVAAGYVAAQGMDERDATRVFAITNAALMDALIACWDAKYFYWTIRPSQVTTIPLAFGLPNHPSYPSGHSCGSAAAATVLTQLFPEHGDQLQAWVEDASLSRILAGIHYRFDVVAGQALGASVAHWTLANADRLR
jgi:hypothetical protein